MDQQTLGEYNTSATEYARRWEQADGILQSLLPQIFPEKARILEIGFGSGRDLAFLHGQGMDVWGVEPAEKLKQQAIALHPELAGRLFIGSLPDDLPASLPDPFDGILLSAVLMHIPDEDLFLSACAIRDRLRKGGKLVISFPSERDDMAPGENRDTSGRLMILRPPGSVTLLFERLGFAVTGTWESADSLGRQGIRWCTVVMTRKVCGVSESIDRIESIINRDRKTATYKFALLKALCDIAQLESETATWDKANNVEIPLHSVSRKWIEYYWPVFASDNFIPQNRGEKESSKKPIAFRKDLSELANYYKSIGSLSQFIHDRDKDKIPKDVCELVETVEKKVNTTIIKGPIFYTGGGNNEEKPFTYRRDHETIVFSSDIWREFILLGHWIGDSINIRWANLTKEFSDKNLTLQEVLALLITPAFNKRYVEDAKTVYGSLNTLECVWTGRTLKRFDVDHAIPYSLRHDNSLWNLFPSEAGVNNSKRDKLPSSNIMKQSRDRIIYYWETLQGKLSALFLTDFRRFTGQKVFPDKSWQALLFRTFAQAIETTASLRGVERWEP